MQGTSNVYTQHKSLLWYTVESLIKGNQGASRGVPHHTPHTSAVASMAV